MLAVPFEGDEDSPRQPSTQPAPKRCASPAAQQFASRRAPKPGKQHAQQAQRFEDLVKTHADACGDVAVALRRDLHCSWS
jgi:hypothetical protein